MHIFLSIIIYLFALFIEIYSKEKLTQKKHSKFYHLLSKTLMMIFNVVTMHFVIILDELLFK